MPKTESQKGRLQSEIEGVEKDHAIRGYGAPRISLGYRPPNESLRERESVGGSVWLAHETDGADDDDANDERTNDFWDGVANAFAVRKISRLPLPILTRGH